MSHLSPDELIDAVEQTLAPERQQHMSRCQACRDQAASLATLLRDVREVRVPEPSPLFWDSLSQRIRAAIQLEGSPASSLRRWFQWPVLVPVGGLALLILALVLAVPQPSAPRLQQAEALAPVAVPDVPAESESSWELLAMLVEGLDSEGNETANNVSPGSADEAVMQLSSLEQQELMRLLQAELERDGG